MKKKEKKEKKPEEKAKESDSSASGESSSVEKPIEKNPDVSPELAATEAKMPTVEQPTPVVTPKAETTAEETTPKTETTAEPEATLDLSTKGGDPLTDMAEVVTGEESAEAAPAKAVKPMMKVTEGDTVVKVKAEGDTVVKAPAAAFHPSTQKDVSVTETNDMFKVSMRFT